jgi:hypothetical protein
MNALLESVVRSPQQRATTGVAQELRRNLYSIVAGTDFANWCSVTPSQWVDFSAHWHRLTLDRYMGDGGLYRYRRYGQFETDDEGQLHLLAHAPYEQPSYVNRLNGGIARMFDPLEDSFVQHPVLHGILKVLRQTFNAANGENIPWNIRLHPYRIIATSGALGQPTPEGLHRDGVDYIVTVMVQRHNINGGVSTATDANGTPIARLMLSEPMQSLLLDDKKAMHEVSALTPQDVTKEAWRDMLVIAFTRLTYV